MKAVSFEEQNIEIGKGQEDLYTILPAKMNDLDVAVPVTFCMELDEEELKKVNQSKNIWITVLTFGQGFQPIRVETEQPVFPVVSGFGDRPAEVVENKPEEKPE